MAQFFVQDPSESVEYQMSWSNVLPTDVLITSSAWSSDDLTIADEALEGAFTAAYVSGGTIGKRYQVTNVVTLNNGEIYSDSVFITFEDK